MGKISKKSPAGKKAPAAGARTWPRSGPYLLVEHTNLNNPHKTLFPFLALPPSINWQSDSGKIVWFLKYSVWKSPGGKTLPDTSVGFISMAYLATRQAKNVMFNFFLLQWFNGITTIWEVSPTDPINLASNIWITSPLEKLSWHLTRITSWEGRDGITLTSFFPASRWWETDQLFI